MNSFVMSRGLSVCSFLPSSLKAICSTRKEYRVKEIAVDLEALDPQMSSFLCFGSVSWRLPVNSLVMSTYLSVCSFLPSSLKAICLTRTEYSAKEIAVDLKALDLQMSSFLCSGFVSWRLSVNAFVMSRCLSVCSFKSKSHMPKQNRIQCERNSSRHGGFGSADIFISLLRFCCLEASCRFFCNVVRPECVLLLTLKSQSHMFNQKRIWSERNSSRPGDFGSADVFFSLLWFCFLEASCEFFFNV